MTNDSNDLEPKTAEVSPAVPQEAQKTFRAPNLQHGGYARFPLSTLPKTCAALNRKMQGFRAALEGMVAERFGEITHKHALLIHSAVVHETLAAVWERKLRFSFDKATYEQLAACTDRISRERDRRDATIEKLGLDEQHTTNVHDVLFGARPTAPDAEQPTPAKRLPKPATATDPQCNE